MSAKAAEDRKNNVREFPVAHTLSDAVNSGNTLQGYAAMNDPKAESEISEVAANEQPTPEEHYDVYGAVARRAYELYLERNGQNGSAEDDWFRAEQEVHHRRGSGR